MLITTSNGKKKKKKNSTQPPPPSQAGPPKPSRAAASVTPPAISGAPSYFSPPSIAPEPKPPTSEDADLNPYIRELLKKSEPLRETRRKERLAAFNKKVFSDGYFDYETNMSGAMRGVKPETRAAIEKWMRDNDLK